MKIFQGKQESGVRSQKSRAAGSGFFYFCLLSSVFCLLVFGCAHTVEITDQAVKAGKMRAGQNYTAPMDGWFVSDEGVSKILKAIEYYKYKWQECEAGK